MLSLNIIDCRKKTRIEVFAYTLSMHNKSSTAGNIGVFENFNITHNLVRRLENPGANVNNTNDWNWDE